MFYKISYKFENHYGHLSIILFKDKISENDIVIDSNLIVC